MILKTHLFDSLILRYKPIVKQNPNQKLSSSPQIQRYYEPFLCIWDKQLNTRFKNEMPQVLKFKDTMNLFSAYGINN